MQGNSENALISGGKNDLEETRTNNAFNSVEKYNGVICITTYSMCHSRDRGSGGSDIGIVSGGYNSKTIIDSVEKYSHIMYTDEIYLGWHVGQVLNETRYNHAGCGSTNAALAIGGQVPGFNLTSTTEKYDGTKWTTGAKMITSRKSFAACGTSDSSLVFGGYNGPKSSTEKYDGTKWYTDANMNIARYRHTGCGSFDAALAFGGKGTKSSFNSTEKYINKSWGIDANMNIARYDLSGCGNFNAALAIGGNEDTIYSNTEIYNGIIWHTDSNTNVARSSSSACGNTGNALVSGGSISSSGISDTERYNGITWYICGNMVTPRMGLDENGSTSAALVTGGQKDTNTPLSSTEIYGGIDARYIDRLDSIILDNGICYNLNEVLNNVTIPDSIYTNKRKIKMV